MKSGTKRHTSGTVPSTTRATFADTIAAGRRSAVPKPAGTTKEDWEAYLAREEARYRDGEARLRDDPAHDADPVDPDSRQRQLTRLGNAAGGAGLSLLMLGRSDEAAGWLERAAERYRESFRDAPPGSWGRPIGAMKALVLAGDRAKAEDAVRARDDFPNDVGDALAFLAAQDVAGYETAVESVLESFETRDDYLEDLLIADTVLVLQVLAEHRRPQVGGQAGCEQLRSHAQRPRDRPVRLLAALPGVDEGDQPGPQQHPHVEVQMARIDTQLACELAVRDRVLAARPEHLQHAEAERVAERLQLLRLVEDEHVENGF